MFIFMYNIYAETRDINVMSLCQTRCKENPTRTSDSNNISTEVICSLHLIIWIILNTFPNNKVTSSERNSKIACVSYFSYTKPYRLSVIIRACQIRHLFWSFYDKL
uniref:Uncharacterized protein n=1 Tax=Cacopsylla melanoneura TaxID=428564 RepID=A0A8D9E724_9HEMI